MVRAGERYEEQGIIVEVVEVNPLQFFDKRKGLQVAYRIRDGDWVSPIAHWWQLEREDPRPIIERIVENYLAIRNQLRR